MSTEGYSILSSGSIIVPSNEYVQFEIDGLRFRFSFLQESQDENADVQITKTIESDSSGQKCLTILISNLKNAFFGATKHSIQVATIKNHPLSVRFSILSINKDEETNSEDKILFYTWYLSNNEVVAE